MQSDVDLDVIIVDDHSSDDSVSVAQMFADTDDRIKVIRHAHNQGPVATFNDGLAAADGEFVVRLDADDLLTPGSLARAVALLDQFPSVGLVYGHPVHFADEPPATTSQLRSWTVWPGLKWLERRCRLGVNCITSPEVVMRHDVIRLVGGQRELAHTHDMEMWMRIATVADIAHVDGPDQALHREHPASRSARMVDAHVDNLERRAAFDLVFASNHEADHRLSDLHHLAQRGLAAYALRTANQAFDRGRSEVLPIDDIAEFARDVYPRFNHLWQWHGFRLRRRIGPSRVHRWPPFVVCAAVRRLTNDFAYWRWSRTGV